MYSQSASSLGTARCYLDEKLSDKVTLNDLAKFTGLPSFQLTRAFRQACRVTPHAYQLQARVRRAHKLVRTGIGLAEVAIASGVADQSHLTRVYKSIMGATPGEFWRSRNSRAV